MLIEFMLETKKQEKYTSEVDMGAREVLNMYYDKKNRVKLLRQKKIKLEAEIEKLNNSIVRDTVSGGMGGNRHYIIEGRPEGIINSKRAILKRRIKKLEEEELQLALATEEVEDYIRKIANFEIKNMFELYFLNGLTWNQVAKKMNTIYPSRKTKYTDENCRKKIERFLKNMK